MNAIALRETWLTFQTENRCSVDRMICKPEFRNAFLTAARSVTGIDDEEILLWSIVSLRKNKSLPAVLK